MFNGLVDTGCSRTIVSSKIVAVIGSSNKTVRADKEVMMMDGSLTTCTKVIDVVMTIDGITVKLSSLVMDILPTYDVLLGIDAITMLGGVSINRNGQTMFGELNFSYAPVSNSKVDNRKEVTNTSCCVQEKGNTHSTPDITINDDDFAIKFREGIWKVEWKWERGEEPSLCSSPPNYKIPDEYRIQFEKEIDTWINNK